MKNRRKLKAEVLTLLANEPLSTIIARTEQYDLLHLSHVLFVAICRPEPKVRWHGVSLFGIVVNKVAERESEAARMIMRRFLWSLNDESGGIGWGAPEAMAECMARNSLLAQEYCHMLVSYMRDDGPELFQDGNYLELPELQRGLLWGIHRLLVTRPGVLADESLVGDLVKYLQSADGPVRGLAARCLAQLPVAEVESAAVALRSLAEDQTSIEIYEDGAFFTTTVASLARQALELLSTDARDHGANI